MSIFYSPLLIEKEVGKGCITWKRLKCSLRFSLKFFSEIIGHKKSVDGFLKGLEFLWKGGQRGITMVGKLLN